MEKEARFLNGTASMMVRLLLSSICACTIACSPKSEQTPQKLDAEAAKSKLAPSVIYGDDDRHDLYEVADQRDLSIAHSTVAVMSSSDLRAEGERFILPPKTFGSEYNLCASEPFREQPNHAFCSGTLVGPDLILTAGHCVRTQSACNTTRFVFDYAVTAPGVFPSVLAKSQVYSCVSIVAREELSSGADYAIVRIDRVVTDREPIAVLRDADAKKGDEIFVVGHPAGLPTKIAGGAAVRDDSNVGYLVANLDTYGGNSGSGVFDARSGVLVGVLVRGETDFVSTGGCRVSNICSSEGCRGEDVTKASSFVSHLPGGEEPEPENPAVEFLVTPELLIPDNTSAGISVKIPVTEVAAGRLVQVKIDLSHSFRGDLVVTLTSPSGKKKVLHSRDGDAENDLHGTYGKDLVPVDSLVDLSAEGAGDYILEVQDLAAADVGTLHSVAILLRDQN
mgnify:CR=1 FL=1